MSVQEESAQEKFERIIENLDHPMGHLNSILFKVLEHIGLRLFDFESISMADLTAVFRMVFLHSSLDDLDRGLASDYLREFQTNFDLLVTSRRNLRSPDLIENYRHYSWTAGLFARSLAYHVEGKLLFKLPDYVRLDEEIKDHMDMSHDLCVPTRILWLEQRNARGEDPHPSEGRFDKLTLEYNDLQEGLSERVRKQYLDTTDESPCLEWKTLTAMVSILTFHGYYREKFIQELEERLDKRRVPLSDTSSYNEGDDDNDDSENTQHSETSLVAVEAKDSGSGSETSSATALESPPIYPPLWTFTTPCTREAMSAADEKDRQCYICHRIYGVAFSNAAHTEPTGRSSRRVRKR